MSLCDPKASETLKLVLRKIPDLQRYVKECSTSELKDALDVIYMHQPHLRQIVHDELAVRAHAETSARSEKSLDQAERHHSDRQWWTRFSVLLAVASFLLALASFLIGRLLPTSQVSSLEQRLATVEQKLAITPQRITPLPSPSPHDMPLPNHAKGTINPMIPISTPTTALHSPEEQ